MNSYKTIYLYISEVKIPSFNLFSFLFFLFSTGLQSGRCSPAKHGGAYFSAVYGFIKDPIVAPGLFEIQEV